MIVGELGKVKGNIQAEHIMLFGYVEGDVVAKDLIEIMHTGKLIGDIEAANLTIQKGGLFSGTSKMAIRQEVVETE